MLATTALHPQDSIVVEGQPTAVLSLVRARLGLIPAALRRRIETADPEMLEALLQGLLQAPTMESVLRAAA